MLVAKRPAKQIAHEQEPWSHGSIGNPVAVKLLAADGTMAAFHALSCNLQVQRPKANAKSLFVKPSLRKGILPSILGALIEARKATRAALKDAQEPTTRAILDSRQKALKLTASELCSHSCINTSVSLRAKTACTQAAAGLAASVLHALQCSAVAASLQHSLPPWSCHVWLHGDRAAATARHAAADALYGFTGAQASNLQSVALADSCLALGAKVGLSEHLCGWGLMAESHVKD